jgi:hypothetical protein
MTTAEATLRDWSTDDISAMAHYTINSLAADGLTTEGRKKLQAGAAEYLEELSRRAGARKGEQYWTQRR